MAVEGWGTGKATTEYGERMTREQRRVVEYRVGKMVVCPDCGGLMTRGSRTCQRCEGARRAERNFIKMHMVLVGGLEEQLRRFRAKTGQERGGDDE